MTIFVKSVEYVEINVLGTEIDVSSNLTKGQDYRNCVPFMTSHSSNDYLDSKLFDMFFSGTFLNGIINFSRSNLRLTTATIKCYVVEFYPLQVRVQQGSFDNSTATIDTVTIPTTLNSINKAGFTFGWKNSSTSTVIRASLVRGRLVDDSTIEFYRTNTGGNSSGHWFIFEDLNNNFNVTHFLNSYSGTGQSVTIDSGRCIDPLRTFLLSSYTTDCANDDSEHSTMRAFFYTNGVIRSDRQVASYSIFWSAQVIEFLDQDKVFVPFDHYLWGSTAHPVVRTVGANANKVPFSCDMDYSMACSAMVQGLSRCRSASPVDLNEGFWSIELTDANTLTYEKNGASYTTYPSMGFAVDWRGIPVDIGTNDSPIPEGAGPGQSFVKSVENFRFTLDDHFGAKILSKGQDWENCVAFASNRGTGSDTALQNMATVYMVSPGIVCFRSWTTTNRIIDVSVVEFWPNQVKVQHQVRHTQRTGTTTTDIEPVSDINRAFLTSKIGLTTTSNIGNKTTVRTRLKSTSEVEFFISSDGADMDVAFFVIEDLQDNFDTRHFLASSAATTLNTHDDSFDWEKDQTFTLTSYTTDCANDDVDHGYIRSYYVNEFRPTYSERHIASYSLFIASTVVRFRHKSEHIHHVNKTFSAASHTGTYGVTASGHENALTCVNNVQSGSMRCAGNSGAGISDSFGTIRIIDYEARTYELSKSLHAYTSYGGFVIIDWIGQTLSELLPTTTMVTPTRNVVKSIQTYSYEGTGGYLPVYLTKGQNIKKCVPFLSASAASSNFDYNRMYKAIYRQDNVGRFDIRFAQSATSSRKVTAYFVEFGDNIKVQNGGSYEEGTTKIFTINEVNLDRAFLVFYAWSDSTYNSLNSIAVCGYFKSSTELEFIRQNGNGTMYISWYVVECSDDTNYWKVQHVSVANTFATTINVPIPNHVANARSLYLASYSHDCARDHPNRNLYRMCNKIDHYIEFSRTNASYTLQKLNVEVVEFSTILAGKGFKTTNGFITLNGGTTSTNYALAENFDLTRSMVISGNQQNEGRCDTTVEQGCDEGYHHYTFSDSSTVTAVKSGGAGYTSYSVFFAYQWPEYNKYYIEGTVVEALPGQEPVFIDREVLAYRVSTGELVDKTTSSGGYFFVETPYPDKHFIVCRDDVEGRVYNDLIYGNMQPAVISGTFAYNEGLVTISGMDVGIPLGRL